MGSAYTEPVDDGLPMRKAGLQAVAKLDYLGRYMDAFITSMRLKPWRAIRYIDLFAGPGKCIVEPTGQVILGSPLLALSTRYPFTDCVFVELDPANARALATRCMASERADTVRCIEGDSNQLVDGLVEEFIREDQAYRPDTWDSLNLAFLDPEGFELHWRTVEMLARLRTDLIVYYPQAGLQRNFELFMARDDETPADAYFGSRYWRRIYSEYHATGSQVGIHRLLMDHYRQRLIGLGYSEVTRDDEIEPLMRAYRTGAPLYRLMFASKSPLGHKFWRSVTRRDVHGQRRLF